MMKRLLAVSLLGAICCFAQDSAGQSSAGFSSSNSTPSSSSLFIVGSPSCSSVLVSSSSIAASSSQVLSFASSSSIAASPSSQSSMVLIPKGCFTMGSPDGNWDEKPAHQVCVSAFKIDRTEVTQAEYTKVTKHNPSWFVANSYFAWNRCVGDCPVENVTWTQASEYCVAVGKRLPTEAEWEYAARGGSATKYACGNSKQCLADFAWFGENADGKSHPVAQKKPNGYGLYDMFGNVAEWVFDIYDEQYYRHVIQQDPKGAFEGATRSVRGSDYDGAVYGLRSAYRSELMSIQRDATIGFRCAQNPDR